MDEENISFRVGGIEVRAVRGQTILQALLAEGKDVPHICYQPNLGQSRHVTPVLLRLMVRW